jgi:hypothetical protein
MATLSDLENAIDSLLQHPGGASSYQLVRHVEDQAYEAYVFGLCLRAVRELNVTPVLRGISGTPAPFVFRGRPGQIHSTHRNYGFAEFALNGHEFEIHGGVEFKGSSGMTHEIDVCIMRAEDARRCRAAATRSDPVAASLIGAWECQFYPGNLKKEHGRTLVGLLDDMGSNYRQSGLCSNSDHPQLRDYFSLQRRPYPHFKLTPLEPSNEDIFVNQIKGDLKKMTASS